MPALAEPKLKLGGTFRVDGGTKVPFFEIRTKPAMLPERMEKLKPGNSLRKSPEPNIENIERIRDRARNSYRGRRYESTHSVCLFPSRCRVAWKSHIMWLRNRNLSHESRFVS